MSNQAPRRGKPREYTTSVTAIPAVGDRVRFAGADGVIVEGTVRTKFPSKFQRAPSPSDREGVHGYRLGIDVGEEQLRYINAEAAIVMIETESLRRTSTPQRRSRS